MKQVLFVLISIIFLMQNSVAQYVDEDFINRNNDFSFSLLSELSNEENNNVFFSSFSISTALAMTYDGARWFTAIEMQRVMNFHKNRDINHNQFTELLAFYRNLKHGFLHIANAAVAQKNYTFLESYFEQIKNYGALLKTANFRDDDDREKARKQINKWVADNTNNRIKELLDENALDALTRLVLLNAIHFNADWAREFSDENTAMREFKAPTGNVNAEFMHMQDNMNYYQNEELQMVQLAYLDTIASMYVILPLEEVDMQNFIRNLNNKTLNSYIEGIKSVPVQLSMPKFTMETEYELKDVFERMGMIRAFSLRADFSGMTGNRDLMIDQVIHKAFIEVDEKGTEAAAATAVIMREKSAMRYIDMNINRPFIFIIKEHTQNSILFMGKVVNPNAS